MSNAQPDIQGTVFDDPVPELTRSYADALVAVAARSGQADAVVDELEEMVDDLVVHDRRFEELFHAPAVGVADKDRALLAMFDGRADPILVNFLRVLNKHGRMGLLGPVSRKAREILDVRQNRKRATVTTAAPIEDDQRERLRARVGAMIGAEPVLRYEVDPALIGGLIVQVGDVVYDASVRRQLKRFRQHLIETKARELATQGTTLGAV